MMQDGVSFMTRTLNDVLSLQKGFDLYIIIVTTTISVGSNNIYILYLYI